MLAPSFGDIFRTNAVNSGLAPIVVAPADLARLREALADAERADRRPRSGCASRMPDGLELAFELDPYAQETLVHGLDDVARTLRREDEIAAFEARYEPRFDLARISR